MDWSKAKTILIIAFIITNIFVLYVIMDEKPADEPTVSKEFIANVEQLLKDKGINIDTDIPTDIPHLNSVIVEFETADAQQLNKDYFNNKGIIEYKQNIKEIKKKNESILVINDRLIMYENKREEEVYKDLDEDKAIEISKQFINNGNFNTSDMKLTFIKEENGVFFIEYSKIYDDILVERTFTNLQVDKRGVKRFERQWLNTKELGKVDIYISTAPKALLTLLDMQEGYDKTITDISLCYYFDPERHEYLQEPGKAKQGKAIPAWRIQFNDGYKIFIDEYLRRIN